MSTYELTAPVLRGAHALTFDAVECIAASANEIPYEAKATAGQIEKRLIERQRSLYREKRSGRAAALGPRRVDGPARRELQARVDDRVAGRFSRQGHAGRDAVDSQRPREYRDLDGDGPFWIPSGRVFLFAGRGRYRGAGARERARAFLSRRTGSAIPSATRPSSPTTRNYNLSLVYTRDAAGNETASEPDYRVLQPRKVTDPNGNRAEARFDALGMLAGTALLGKAIGPVEGDSFDQFVTELTPAQMKEFFDADDPYALASEHLGTATTRILYDLKRVPMCAASIARETHVSDIAPGEQTRVQLHFVYSDGFGREAQSKIQAEPGPLNPDDPGSPVANPRWVGSGARIYNNKGKPVREYEPFFSTTPHFGIEKWGVSNTLFYDPVLRVVATLHPNNTYEKVIFDPWKQTTFDVNDTVTFDPKTDPDVGEYFSRLPDSDYLPTWYQQRIDGAEGPHERAAAIKASKDADTPTIAHFDTLGRTVSERRRQWQTASISAPAVCSISRAINARLWTRSTAW